MAEYDNTNEFIFTDWYVVNCLQ